MVMLSILLIVIQAIARDQETVKLLLVGMPDVQNFFHEVLAVILSKHLHTRRKFSVSSIASGTTFQLHVQCVRKLRPF